MKLFKQLFPERSDQPRYDCYQWVKLWMGFYVNNAVLPINMLVTYLKPTVQWGGAAYVKHQGRVCKRSQTC